MSKPFILYIHTILQYSTKDNNTRMFHPWPEETPLKIKLRNVGHYILN